MPKILVVDDDPISLRIAIHHLEQNGYDTIAAENGQQALNLLQSAPNEFSLVLTDRIMPKLHGLDLIKQMKADATLHNIPTIMLTGVADKEEMIETIKAGVFDFIYKPIEQELLLLTIKRALAQNHTTAKIQHKT